MATTKVILRQPLDNLGGVGEVVSVKPGYARNYLLPHGLAYEASDANLRRLERERERLEREAADNLELAREEAVRLEGMSLTFQARAGEEGKLFGSITNQDIVDGLEREGVSLERRAVDLPEPIKQLGVYTVKLHLHPEVRPEIKVWVVKEAE
ncbi:MAG: 50S ribosomal protein L9 [Longimicrobiaceae bacterium]